ncbi:hypothetical protein JKP88DRAFT_224282 [Tribonema minus]|uniref:Uncharacterized protein n=1 Tax=Tribonema minus TaxID=303371 RepID=A0A836CBI7_9STRA|nr:hypothetical protein JKP88DRAFT_224282 [Tribonema minus]
MSCEGTQKRPAPRKCCTVQGELRLLIKLLGAAQAWPPPLKPTPPVTVRFLLSQGPVHFGFLLASPLRQCKNRHPRLHGFLCGQWPRLARTHLDHSRHRHEVLGCGHTLGGRCRCSFRLPRPAICIWPRAFPRAARSTCAAAHSCAPAAVAASAGTGKASAAAHLFLLPPCMLPLLLSLTMSLDHYRPEVFAQGTA